MTFCFKTRLICCFREKHNLATICVSNIPRVLAFVTRGGENGSYEWPLTRVSTLLLASYLSSRSRASGWILPRLAKKKVENIPGILFRLLSPWVLCGLSVPLVVTDKGGRAFIIVGPAQWSSLGPGQLLAHLVQLQAYLEPIVVPQRITSPPWPSTVPSKNDFQGPFQL